MTTAAQTKPAADEYFHDFETYIRLTPEGDIIETLQTQFDAAPELIAQIPADTENFAYADGKWTVKELLGHIVDAEHIMGYRARRIARGDTTPIEGFEQDDYIAGGNFNTRTLDSLLTEFQTVRLANILLLRSLDEEAWLRRGTASGKGITVRALAHILAGHVTHHANILRERYLSDESTAAATQTS